MTTTPRPRPIHFALAGAAFALTAACSIGPKDAAQDLDGGSVRCSTTQSGDVVATGSVTNGSAKASTYWVDIEISVDGAKVGTRTAVVEDVEPGDRVPLEVTLRDAPDGAPSCEVTDVLRLKA